MITLHPIDINDDKTKESYANPDCQELFKTYREFYKKIGYNPPWIGYFVIRDNLVVGCCGFVSQPNNTKVEIAYWTFKQFEGQGVSSESCKQLVAMTRQTDPTIIITAKTLPEHNASTKILERNGFVLTGPATDEDGKDVWEWTCKNS